MSLKLRKKYLGHPAAQELVNFIKASNFCLIVRQTACYPDIFAEFDNEKKRIYVTIRDEKGRFRSRADFIFLLAHETRHLQHWMQGLYKNYYQNNPQLIKYFGPGKRHKMRLIQACSILVAVRAERDCDKFARDFLNLHLGKCHKLNPLLTVIYPASDVVSYGDYQGLVSDNMRGVSEKYEKWKKRWILTEDDLKKFQSVTARERSPHKKRGLKTRIIRLLRDAKVIEGLCAEISLVRKSVRDDIRQIQATKKLIQGK